jgi:hypothetical protein
MSVNLLTNAPWMNARVGSVSTNNLTLNGLQFPTNTPTNGQVLTYNSATNNIQWQAGGGGGGSVVYETLQTPINFYFMNGNTSSNLVGTSTLYLSRVGDNVSCRLDLTPQDVKVMINPSTDECDSIMGVASVSAGFIPVGAAILLQNKVNLLYTSDGATFTSFNYGSMVLYCTETTIEIGICNDNNGTFKNGCHLSIGATQTSNASGPVIIYPPYLSFSYSVN